MNEDRNIGHVYIPSHIMERSDLTLVEKVLYGKIIGLTAKDGFCYANNDWLCRQIGVSQSYVSNSISKFVKLELLKREIIRNEKKEIIQRKLVPFMIGITPTSDRGITPTSEDIQDILDPRNNNNISPSEIVATPPKKAKIEKPTDPRVNVLRDFFCAKFKEFTNQEATWEFGRDGHLVKKLLAVHPIEEIQDHIEKFFTVQDSFIAKAGRRFTVFYSQYDKISSMAPMYADECEQDYWTVKSELPGTWYYHEKWLKDYYRSMRIKLATKDFTDFTVIPDSTDAEGKLINGSPPEWAGRFMSATKEMYPKVWADLEKRFLAGELPQNIDAQIAEAYKQTRAEYELRRT